MKTAVLAVDRKERCRLKHAAKIAVTGAGLIGRKHIDAVAKCAHLAAIIDPSPRAQGLAAQLNTVWFETLDECLDRDRPDGVILATPNQLHAEQAIACIRRGVPVLVEKPIADSSANASRIVEAAHDADIPVLVGHHRRHNPIIRVAKAAIESGKLGRLVAVNAQCWLYKPDEYFEPQWRREEGGGPVLINLIHDLDLLRHLCGEIVRVQTISSHRMRGFAVEDSAAILLAFENGAVGTVSVSDTAVAPWSWEFTAGENPAYPNVAAHAYSISGTHGALSVPDLKLWNHPGKRGWWEPIEYEQLPAATADPFIDQLEHFLKVIAREEEPLVSAEDAARTLLVIEEIKLAGGENRGRRVDYDGPRHRNSAAQ